MVTLREIFTSTAEGATSAFNWFLDTDLFVLGGGFITLVMCPYYAFTLLREKETGKKVVGGLLALGSLFFYYLLIDIFI